MGIFGEFLGFFWEEFGNFLKIFGEYFENCLVIETNLEVCGCVGQNLDKEVKFDLMTGQGKNDR